MPPAAAGSECCLRHRAGNPRQAPGKITQNCTAIHAAGGGVSILLLVATITEGTARETLRRIVSQGLAKRSFGWLAVSTAASGAVAMLGLPRIGHDRGRIQTARAVNRIRCRTRQRRDMRTSTRQEFSPTKMLCQNCERKRLRPSDAGSSESTGRPTSGCCKTLRAIASPMPSPA